MANYTYYATAGTTALGFTTAFAFNSPYIVVQNTSANVLYITTDGKTVPVTTGGDGIWQVPANSAITIPNEGSGTWHQSQSVIPAGTYAGGSPGTPAEIQPYGSSLAGGKSDPGVVINAIASAASTTFVLTAAG